MTTSRTRLTGTAFILLMLMTVAVLLSSTLVQATGTLTFQTTAWVQPRIVHSVTKRMAVPDWLEGSQATIRDNLIIGRHPEKHRDEAINAWMLYDLLLANQCVASRSYCGDVDRRGNSTELHLCVEPVTGIVSALLVSGDMIFSAYGATWEYWHDKLVNGDQWGPCNGGDLWQ